MVNAHLARLEALARAALAAEGFAEHEMRVERTADLRYFGQAWEVAVELPAGVIDERQRAVAGERFHDAHEQRYGYSYRRRPIAGRRAVRRGVGEPAGHRHRPDPRPRLRELPAGDGASGPRAHRQADGRLRGEAGRVPGLRAHAPRAR